MRRLQLRTTALCLAVLLFVCTGASAARSRVRGSLSPMEVVGEVKQAVTELNADEPGTTPPAPNPGDSGTPSPAGITTPPVAAGDTPPPAAGTPAAPGTHGPQAGHGGSAEWHYDLKPGTDVTPITLAMSKVRRTKVKLDKVMSEQPVVREELQALLAKEHEATGQTQEISAANDEMKAATVSFQGHLAELLGSSNQLLNDAQLAKQDGTAENLKKVGVDLGHYEEKRDATSLARDAAMAKEDLFNEKMSAFREHQVAFEKEYAELEKKRFRMRLENFEAIRQLFQADTELATWAKDVGLVSQEDFDSYVKSVVVPKWSSAPEDPKFFLISKRPLRVPQYKCHKSADEVQEKTSGTHWAVDEHKVEPRALQEIGVDDAIAYQIDQDIVECYSIVELHNDWEAKPDKWGIKPGSSPEEEFNDMFMSQFEMQEKHLGLSQSRPKPDPRPCAKSAEDQENLMFGDADIKAISKEEEKDCIQRHPGLPASEIVKLLRDGTCQGEKADETAAAENEVNLTNDQKDFAMECGLLDTPMGPQITARLIKDKATLDDCKDEEKIAALRKELSEADNERIAPEDEDDVTAGDGNGDEAGDDADESGGKRRRNRGKGKMVSGGSDGVEDGSSDGPELATDGNANKAEANLKSGQDGEVLAAPDGTFVPGPKHVPATDDGTCEYTHVEDMVDCSSGRPHSVLSSWDELKTANTDVRVIGCKSEASSTLNCYDVLELSNCFRAEDGGRAAKEARKDPFVKGNIFPTRFMTEYKAGLDMLKNDIDEECSSYVFKEFDMEQMFKDRKTDSREAIRELENKVNGLVKAALPRAIVSTIHSRKLEATQLENLMKDMEANGGESVEEVMKKMPQEAGVYQVVAAPGVCSAEDEGPAMAGAGELQYTLMDVSERPSGRQNPFLGWSVASGAEKVECFQVMKLVRWWLQQSKRDETIFGINPEKHQCAADAKQDTPTCQFFTPDFIYLVKEKFSAYVEKFIAVCKKNAVPASEQPKVFKYDSTKDKSMCFKYP